MKEWYNLNDIEYDKLIKRVSVLDLIKSRHIFHAEDQPVSKINLLLYLDDYGPEASGKHHFIFRACFNSLDGSDKADVIKYIDWLENE